MSQDVTPAPQATHGRAGLCMCAWAQGTQVPAQVRGTYSQKLSYHHTH